MRNTPTPFHASFFAFRNPSHPSLGSHKAPKPLFMLHFSVSKPFPPHSWEPWSTQPCFHASFLAFPDPSHPTLGNHEAPKPFFMLHFLPSQAFPTPLLGTMRNARTPFHVSLLAFPSPSHPTLGNHEKHPNPIPIPLLGAMKHPNHFSCFILAFPSPSHPTLGNHEARNPVFMLHSWPSQTLPTPRLGTMKHPNPFSCFILRLPKPFPPHSWEPWTSFWCFRLFPPHSWEPWETPTTLFMFHFQLSETPLTLGNHEKHPNPFSCFIFSLPKLFPPHSWESWEIPTPVFMLHFYGLFLGTVRNTQTPFHASFLAWEGWKLLLLEIPLVDESDRCGTWPDPFLNSLHELWLSFPPSQVFQKNPPNPVLFEACLHVFAMFFRQNTVIYTCVAIKAFQNTFFYNVSNSLVSPNPWKRRYLHCFLQFFHVPMPLANSNIYTKNASNTLFFYSVFTMFSVENTVMYTFFGIKSVQSTRFCCVFNALASKKPSIPLSPQTLENTAICTVFFNSSMCQCRWPTHSNIYTKNYSNTLFFFYSVFTFAMVFRQKHRNLHVFRTKSVQNTGFCSAFNALASKNLSKYRYLQCFFISVRFSIAGSLPKWPKFHFNTLLSSDTQKSSNKFANTTNTRSRCEIVFAPPPQLKLI